MISVYGEPITDNFKSQIFTADDDLVLRAFRARLISFGDPLFTNIQAVLFNVRGSILLDEIGRSENLVLKSELQADSLNEVYFDFEPAPEIRKNSKFALGFDVSGYTASEAQHLAIMSSWLMPIYSGSPNLGSAPLYFGVIGEVG